MNRIKSALILLLIGAMVFSGALAELSYNPFTGELRLNAGNLYPNKTYTLAIVRGSGEARQDLSRASMLWFDRFTAPSGEISVRIVNQDLPECTVLLGGEFRGGGSPLVLGSIGPVELDEAQLPDALQAIDDEAFRNTSVNIFYIGDKVESIGSKAFADCADLYIAHVPESVREIGSGAFSNCPNLTIYCKYGSEIQKYAVANNIPWQREG